MTTMTMPRSRGISETGLASTLALAHSVYDAVSRFYRIRRDRRVLQSMPDYLLRDLGISRSEIESVTEFGRPRGGRW